MPAAVIRAADKVLGELEARARAEDEQLDLFAMPEEPGQAAGPGEGVKSPDQAGPLDAHGASLSVEGADAEVLERLRALDPDTLSAREALALLYSLRERLGAGDGRG
jgi:DNA mismatch repair protein MutS